MVDEDRQVLDTLAAGLGPRLGLVETAAESGMAEGLLARCHFDLLICGTRLAGRSGVDWVEELRDRDCALPVIFMGADADLDTAIHAMRLGAADFIFKPLRMEQVHAALRRALERRRLEQENFVLRRQVDQLHEGSGIVGSGELIQGVIDVLRRVAPMPSTVLLEGESGTGKELAARALHRWSRREGAFVPVNCGSMNAELLESELFGHVKGAFTGAAQAREGLFSYADGGTLFLDEIGEMPFGMQTHLLRVMEEHAVRPVGGNSQVPVDVRVVAATNRDLLVEVEAGRFREDLYYRLNVLTIRLPALRERLEDLPELVAFFCEALSRDLGVEPPRVTDAELARLADYDWPGNVRELKNVIERCLLLNHTPSHCVVGLPRRSTGGRAGPEEDSLLLADVERRHILKVLELESGNKSAAARRLGISRKTLERKCQAWGV